MPVAEHWQDEPEDHDFPAAADYLSLLGPPNEVEKVVEALRSAETIHRKAKDYCARVASACSRPTTCT